MNEFTSKTLNRTFDKLLFVGQIERNNRVNIAIGERQLLNGLENFEAVLFSVVYSLLI